MFGYKMSKFLWASLTCTSLQGIELTSDHLGTLDDVCMGMVNPNFKS